MRVLVTGSSGFLGRQVARELAVHSGFEVIGFDLRPSPDGDFESIEADLCELPAVRKACHGIAAVVHFGGVGDVDLAAEHPEIAAAANVVGTTNVAISAREAGARVVYASTWEVYGRPITRTIDELHPCDPHHIYAVTKLAGEQILRAEHRSAGLPIAILRLGTAYGRGMRANTVISRFVTSGHAGRPLLVQGDGRQWRQFTHTSDIARAVQIVLESRWSDLVLNVASDELVTVRRLADLVSRRYDIPVSFGPARQGDPLPARISTARASRTVGWRAEVEFIDGLSDLLDHLDADCTTAANVL